MIYVVRVEGHVMLWSGGTLFDTDLSQLRQNTTTYPHTLPFLNIADAWWHRRPGLEAPTRPAARGKHD